MSKIRLSYFLGFIFIACLLGLAEYLEAYKAMTPCPLCMLQRYALILLGAVFFIGMIFRMKSAAQVIVGLFGLSISVGGILFSGRQVWLQHMPHDGVGECSANLGYMLQVLSPQNAFKQIWTGGMECSQQGWVFLHLTLAEWSLLGFVGFFILVLVQLRRALSS